MDLQCQCELVFFSCSPLQLPCVSLAMLPGYGFSPFPDFQPHLRPFGCRGESPSMWIPGSGESQALSEAQDDRPLLQHKHVAVCQQETLAFIELQAPNGLGSPAVTHCFTHTLSELKDMHRTDSVCDSSHSAAAEDTDKPRTVTTVCRPLHAALSLPLSFPLSSLYTSTDSWESQVPCSPSSPEAPGCQSPDSQQPQRRTSQGSLKEKSIRECAAGWIKANLTSFLLYIFIYFKYSISFFLFTKYV